MKDNQAFKRTFGERLRRERHNHELTEEKLAKSLKVAKTTISNWENGRSLPDAYQLLQLSQLLSVNINYWLTEELEIASVEANGITWMRATSFDNPDIATGVEIFEQIMRGMNTHDLRRLTSDPEKRRVYSQAQDGEFIRLLRSIFLTHSVRISNAKRDERLERQLYDKYSQSEFRQFVVANTSFPSDDVIDSVVRAEVIGFLAANSSEVRNSLRSVTSVGLTGGTPLSRYVDLLQPDLRELDNIEWLSLLSTDSDTYIPKGISANSLVARMIYRQSSSGRLMPFLHHNRRINADDPTHTLHKLDVSERQEIERIYEILDRARNVNAALITVGAAKTNFDDRISLKGTSRITLAYKSLSPREKQICCGDVLLRLIDENGQGVGHDSFIERNTSVFEYNDQVVFSITHEDLRRISTKGHVWILAERPEKAQVIHAALISGLANSAIIDKTIAQILLAL
jgi:transcriptional regulator with XRE-family HTH domain